MVANVFEVGAENFCVLVNTEGQYSLWSVFREPPQGWSVTGPRGTRQTCLDWIETQWVDMRPLSLCKRAPT